MSEELSELLESAESALEARDAELIRKLCEGLHPADLADLYEDQDADMRSFLVDTLGSEAFTEVLAEIPDTLVEETLDQFEPDEQREMFESIPDDDLVDILQDVSESKRKDFIELLDEEQQDNTRTLLRYGEDTAGGRMTTQIAKIRENMTVKEALDHLRPELESTETMARIFVVDKNERLIGKLRLRDLAFNQWDTPISQIYNEDDQSILATADQEEAANMLSRYDLVLLPVVDESKRLLGVITSDDAIEIIEEESTEDMEKAAGITGEQSEESYLNTKIYTHFRRRAGWLIVLAVLAILSGFVMMRFEKTLNDIYLLSLFLTMVVAAGGNTGGQASTMVIRAMALGELDREDTFNVIWKEMRLGILLGGLLAVIIGLVAIFGPPAFGFTLPGDISFVKFGLTVAFALGAQVATSTVIGAMLPIGARSINLDPAVIAAPAITTAVDVSGMVIYFTIAHSILSL